MSKTFNFIEPEVENINAVMQIAEELVNRNKIIQMEKLFRIAKKRLKLSPLTIVSIINYLKRNAQIVERSKLLKDDVLSNIYRKIIFNFINKYPGINFSNLRQFSFQEYKLTMDKPINKGSVGQFDWHLNILIKFKFIRKIEFKNYSLFIPYKMEDKKGLYYFLLRDSINRKIIHVLTKEIEIKSSKIHGLIKESRNSVYYHINVINEYDLVILEKISGNFVVSLNPDNKDLILNIVDDIELKLSELKEKTGVLDKKKERPLKKPKAGVIAAADTAGLSEAEKKEIEKTESEMEIEKKKVECIVHRGTIVGSIYLCPNCMTYYCIKCAKALKEKDEACWSCGEKIDISVQLIMNNKEEKRKVEPEINQKSKIY